ncbi:ATP-binding cassette sub-family C member 2-like isoform X2 [Dermacentor variabilis]|uniref:ATP-binding cassette sub-family C member 2-like isoform X2 n=1 Tax=Dermacentor variabilis TaxID=34621 RepID=UPI003F5B8A7F
MDDDVLETSALVVQASWLLKWAFFACSSLSIVELLQRPNLAPRRPVCFTLYDLGYLVSNGTAVVALVFSNVFLFNGAKEAAPECAIAIALVWLTISAVTQRCKGMSASNFLCALHSIYFVTSLNDFLFRKDLMFAQEAAYSRPDELSLATTSRLLLMVAAMGSFLCTFFRSSPVYDKDKIEVRRGASEETFSPFGKVVGSAVYRHIINAGLGSRTVKSDILPVIRRIKSRLLVRHLRSSLHKWTGHNSGFHILCGFVRILWYEALWVVITGFAFFTNYMIRVPLLEAMIEDFSRQPDRALTVLFVSSCVMDVFLSGFMDYVSLRCTVQLKALMEAALFTKTTRMSARALAETPTGYLVSLVGVDCEQLTVAAIVISQSVSGLLCFPLVLWMLAKRVGVLPVIGCIAWQLASLTLFVPASKVQTGLWRRVNRHRDERLRKMADTLSCVRLVKFYAWEDAAVRVMSRLREREVLFIFLANLLDGFIDSLQNSSSSMMTIILLGTYAAVNRPATLTAARSFSALYMLSIMDVVVVNMASVLRNRSMVSEGLRRMTKTLTAEEETCERNNNKQSINLKKGAVTLRKCSFIWSGKDGDREQAPGEETPVLSDVSIDITPGAFVGVAGLVGSGKSALLAAVLGDLRCIEGDMCVGGSVAYLPQSACIFNMTIRDNVLFGKRMDAGRYWRVLEACDLTRDLELLPAGDLTEVGEKGETLSGGQKQRLALARAAYSDSDVYLVDDTLSALDVRVAAKVFARVLGRDGLLQDKTRIIVCNQGFFLRHVEQLFLVWKKRVLPFRTLPDLINDRRAPKTLLFGSRPGSSVADKRDSGNHEETMDENSVFGKLTADETRNKDLTTVELLRALVTMSGVCFPLAILSIVARAVAVALFLCWIKMWTDAAGTLDNGGYSDATWVTVLGALCVCDLLFGSLAGLLLALSFRRLSSRLHGAMLRRVLLCPVSFFEATPRGRLLNRFSADLNYVDCQFYMTTKEVLQTITVVLARLAVVGTQALTACLLGVAATGVYLVIVTVTVRASNALRSLETACVSRVLQHLTETRDSMSSVRCYGAVALVCRRFCRLLDGALRYFWALAAAVRFTRISGGVAGLCAVVATVLVMFFSTLPLSPSEVGLSLSSAMSIPMLLSAINASLFFCFMATIAFERAVEYTRLQPEDACDAVELRAEGAHSLHTSWPDHGKIAFENFTTSYKPGICPPILKSLTFVIEACERVGVVGRTGAGKSSLVLALLRVLKPSEGRIVIDGIDISSVSLRQLRSVITVIPQEPYLMKGSLRDNLDATQSHSDDEVWEALKKTHMADFVSKHPLGLLLEIDDGAGNLSGGQRQLLCLARALLRRPRVLLLDEATSRMDGDTDRLVQRTLRDGFSRCTVLTIAHRLNTVLHCDRILVMSEGCVAEFGTVADLAANPTSIFGVMARAAGIDTSSLQSSGCFVRL